MEEICPLKKKPCRHCSTEREITVSHVGVVKTGTLEIRRSVVDLGQRCNNHGNVMVSDLEICPNDQIDKMTPEQIEEHNDNPLLWMRLHEGR